MPERDQPITKEDLKEKLVTTRDKVVGEGTIRTTIEQVTSILDQAIEEIGGRATLYDQPTGEESMPKVIDMFNRLYDDVELTVEQGWMLMVLLKAVRSANGGFKLDNYVDLAAYGAFAGKAARDEASKPQQGSGAVQIDLPDPRHHSV